MVREIINCCKGVWSKTINKKFEASGQMNWNRNHRREGSDSSPGDGRTAKLC